MLAYKVLCDPTPVYFYDPYTSYFPLIHCAVATVALFLFLKPVKLAPA